VLHDVCDGIEEDDVDEPLLLVDGGWLFKLHFSNEVVHHVGEDHFTYEEQFTADTGKQDLSVLIRFRLIERNAPLPYRMGKLLVEFLGYFLA